MINTTNFIRSPSPPKKIQGAMKTRSRKGGASEMAEGDKATSVMPKPTQPKDVLTVKRPR